MSNTEYRCSSVKHTARDEHASPWFLSPPHGGARLDTFRGSRQVNHAGLAMARAERLRNHSLTVAALI